MSLARTFSTGCFNLASLCSLMKLRQGSNKKGIASDDEMFATIEAQRQVIPAFLLCAL
jgi:hypothetical protein